MLNCNSLNNKLGEVKDYLTHHKPDVFCLTETWLSIYIPKFHNYIAFWKNRDHAGGGIGILVSITLSHRNLPLTPFEGGLLEAQAISVDLNRSQLVILNVYNPNKNIKTQELEHYVNQLGQNYLIVGDFNAHSPILSHNDTTANPTGRSLEQLLATHHICLNNPYNFYTYLDRSTGRQSCLDLCLSSPNLSPLVKMSPHTDLGSDHRTIKITLTMNCKRVNMIKVPKWKINQKSSEIFKNCYTAYEIQCPTDINTTVKDLTNRITSDANKAFGIPSESVNTNSKRTPWWNKECFEAIKNRRKAKRAAEKNPTSENLATLKELTTLSKTVCTNSKRNSLHKYISSLTYNVSQTEVWNKIKKFKSVYQPTSYPIKERGKAILCPIQKGNAFGQQLQMHPKITLNDSKYKNNIETGCLEPPSNKLGNAISMPELEKTIKTLKNSSAGPDNITNKMIKLLNINYRTDLLNIFNQSLISSTKVYLLVKYRPTGNWGM